VMFCKHDWSVLSESVTESKYEVTIRSTKGFATGKTNIPWQLCDASRKHIVIVCCKKCGKLKRFVEDI
jgi:hypothetical protein